MQNNKRSVRTLADQGRSQIHLRSIPALVFAACSHTLQALWRLALALVPVWAFGQAQMYTPGQFAVAPDGAATYTIPIQVPPGTAGMQPSLSLVYNSHAGNGLVGVGWALSGTSIIYRCGATYVQDGFKGGVNFDGNDRYCLDGQRLIAINTGLAYGAAGQEYRTEENSFTKIVAGGVSGNGPQYFTAYTKSGQTIQYGLTVNVYANSSAYPTVAMWPVTVIRDVAGNSMSFEYYNTAPEFRLTAIKYGANGNAGTAHYASVHFIYETRTDIETSYTSGSYSQVSQRLARVKTCVSQLECFAAPSLVKEYRLAYQVGSATARSHLVSVTECDAASVCLPSTTFTWQDQAPLPALIPWGTQLWGTGLNTTVTANKPSDFDGDGKTDIINCCYALKIDPV